MVEKQPQTQDTTMYMKYRISIVAHITEDTLILQAHTHQNKHIIPNYKCNKSTKTHDIT